MILKVPDVPELAAAARRLVRAGVPVVTVVTDLPASDRSAYVGIDNRSAGATAAYLIGQWAGDRPGNVLVTLSSGFFRGEEEREMGFRSAMRNRYPGRSLVEISESDGLDERLYDLVLAAVRADPRINAVYSIGGGNRATVAAFDALDREIRRCSSRTTSTRTTPGCSARAGCRRCCTTISMRTSAGLAR